MLSKFEVASKSRPGKNHTVIFETKRTRYGVQFIGIVCTCEANTNDRQYICRHIRQIGEDVAVDHSLLLRHKVQA